MSTYRVKAATGWPRNLERRRQDCHDFAIFMIASMLRVDELRHLTFGDCKKIKNSEGRTILELNVRVSKVRPRSGVVCTEPATLVYDRRLGQHGPDDLLFPRSCVREFPKLLKAAELYEDGKDRRNLKSLRATSISFRLLEGVNVTMVAQNAGTSIGSIDKFYAKHLRGTDDVDKMSKTTNKYILESIRRHEEELDKIREGAARFRARKEAEDAPKTPEQLAQEERKRGTTRRALVKEYRDRRKAEKIAGRTESDE